MGSNLVKSFELMGMGMLGIFVVIILIYFVIYLLDKFTKKNLDIEADGKGNEKIDSAATVDNNEEEEVCAIVEAVLCDELHVDPSRLRIIEIKER